MNYAKIFMLRMDLCPARVTCTKHKYMRHISKAFFHAQYIQTPLYLEHLFYIDCGSIKINTVVRQRFIMRNEITVS